MNNVDLFKRWFLSILTVILVLNWCPSQSRADSGAITPSDIEHSDPYEITASIMEIDYGKNMLIIAENEVYLVDLVIGGEFIKSVLSDAHGHAILFDSLDRGQTVTVSGMILSDGRVIAEELVLQSRRPKQ